MQTGKARLLAFFAVMLAWSAWGYEAQVLVIGGKDALAGDWPYMASLHDRGCYTNARCDPDQAPALRSLFCGGTVLDTQWVITAAHCILGYSDADQILVHVGDQPRDERPGGVLADEAIAVEAAWIHPWFVSTNAPDGSFYPNDIALLRLATPVPTSVSVASETQLAQLDPGEALEVLGWGDTDPSLNIDRYVAELQQAPLSLAECNGSTLPGFDGSVMLCAQGEGRDACLGDSGGPLLMARDDTWYQVGIVSWGLLEDDRQCANQYPGVYTRLASFSDWIADVRGGEVAASLPAADRDEGSRRWWDNLAGGAGAYQPAWLFCLMLLALWRRRF